MNDKVDIFYKLVIGDRPALSLNGDEWCQPHEGKHDVTMCPPLGVDIDVCEWDDDGPLEPVAVARVIGQRWASDACYVFCTLQVDSLTGEQRDKLKIAKAGDIPDAPTMTISHYTFGSSPFLVPIDEEPGADFYFDYNAVVCAAGQDPDSEEIVVSQLTEEWQGHAKGDLIVLGLTIEGHEFHVVPREFVVTMTDLEQRNTALQRALVAALERADGAERTAAALREEYAHLMPWEAIVVDAGDDVYVVASEGAYDVPWKGIFCREDLADQYRDFLDGLPDDDRLECQVYRGRIDSEYAVAFWNSYEDPEMKQNDTDRK